MSRKNLLKIALPVGDPAGIGPEICLKAALSEEIQQTSNLLIIGDANVLKHHADLCGLPWDVNIINNISEARWNEKPIAILDRRQFIDSQCQLGTINAENGRAIIDAASAAVELAMTGEVDAVIAAPHTQSAIAKAGIKFDGYPSFVAGKAGVLEDEVLLMLCFDDIRIAHCTLHVGVRDALDLITTDRVRKAIEVVNTTLLKTGIANPSIIVSGLNPHAGENRLFGNEDADIIFPAISSAHKDGINVVGPIGADIMFQHKNIDAYIVMLHDQGHIPAKMIAPRQTVAMSIGLPILFATVAHGSALDIAGKGIADPSAIIKAINLLSAENVSALGKKNE
ncbi:MAG: PdxA family dehydrogenase [Gammaproteobacteria bacterium]|jgi:4-hydroxythreonine-4-phosphate dehydrogenase